MNTEAKSTDIIEAAKFAALATGQSLGRVMGCIDAIRNATPVFNKRPFSKKEKRDYNKEIKKIAKTKNPLRQEKLSNKAPSPEKQKQIEQYCIRCEKRKLCNKQIQKRVKQKFKVVLLPEKEQES